MSKYKLTKGELRVWEKLTGTGMTGYEIAEELCISYSALSKMTHRLYKKFRVNDRVALIFKTRLVE